MAEYYKALAAADLAILPPPPNMIMSPLRDMMTSDESPVESLVYRVPAERQAIVKMIICTSGDDEQNIIMRCYTSMGPMPLFGPIKLGPHEWAEWSGSLTLEAGSEIRGATPDGYVSVGIYGMERTV